MGFTKTFDVSVSISNETINSYLFKCANRLKPNDFTRSGKMSFKETIFFMLNSKKKSLQSELNNFFENILKRDDPISKQAFSEARNKIDPKAFIELNDAINEVIYETHNEYKLWNGYRVSAIDGSIIEIPNTELLRNEYGYIENQNAIVARAKVGCIFDVVNDFRNHGLIEDILQQTYLLVLFSNGVISAQEIQSLKIIDIDIKGNYF